MSKLSAKEMETLVFHFLVELDHNLSFSQIILKTGISINIQISNHFLCCSKIYQNYN